MPDVGQATLAVATVFGVSRFAKVRPLESRDKCTNPAIKSWAQPSLSFLFGMCFPLKSNQRDLVSVATGLSDGGGRHLTSQRPCPKRWQRSTSGEGLSVT